MRTDGGGGAVPSLSSVETLKSTSRLQPAGAGADVFADCSASARWPLAVPPRGFAKRAPSAMFVRTTTASAPGGAPAAAPRLAETLARIPPGAASTARESVDRTRTVAVTKPGDGTALGEGVGVRLGVGDCVAVGDVVSEALPLGEGACDGDDDGDCVCDGDIDGVPVVDAVWDRVPLAVGVFAWDAVTEPEPVGVGACDLVTEALWVLDLLGVRVDDADALTDPTCEGDCEGVLERESDLVCVGDCDTVPEMCCVDDCVCEELGGGVDRCEPVGSCDWDNVTACVLVGDSEPDGVCDCDPEAPCDAVDCPEGVRVVVDVGVTVANLVVEGVCDRVGVMLAEKETARIHAGGWGVRRGSELLFQGNPTHMTRGEARTEYR